MTSLPAERRLLEGAREALTRNQLQQAEERLSRHRRRFPGGELAEERESLAVEVAFAQQRWSQVLSLAAEFQQSYPNSLYRSRVARLDQEARERSHAPAGQSDRSGHQGTNGVHTAPDGEERGRNP